MSRWISERTQNSLPNRHFLLGMSSLVAAPAFAHHGWRWTNTGAFELRGIIQDTDAKSVLTIDADGELWCAECAPRYSNERGELLLDDLKPGLEVILIGKRSQNEAELMLQAECVVLAGTSYDLDPERI